MSDVEKRFSLQTTPESPTQKLLQVLHHLSTGIAKEVATAQKAAMQYTSSHQQLQLLPGSSMNVNLVPKFFWPTRWRFSFWQTTKGKTTSSSFQILQTNRPWYSKATSQTSKNPFNKLSLTLCAAFAKSSAVCDYSVLCSFYCSYSLRLHQRSRPMVKRSTHGQTIKPNSQVQVAKSEVLHLLCAKATEHPNAGRPFHSTKILRWAALNCRYDMN